MTRAAILKRERQAILSQYDATIRVLFMVMAAGTDRDERVNLFRERLAYVRFCLDEALTAIHDETLKRGETINGRENTDSAH